MLKFSRSIDRHRALLTDTLPYEVLPIFSNDKFFLSLVRADGELLNQPIRNFLNSNPVPSKPYNYHIRQGVDKDVLVSVAHPLNQLALARFTSAFKFSILESCRKSRSSLRHPESTLDIFVSELNNRKLEKDGTVTKLTEIFEQDNPAIASFFAYKKYTLLSKFFESDEIKRMERRYRWMRTLDVSRCFYHIYTHTISWAIKTKQTAKQNKGSISFDTIFDEYTRYENSGESVGILVGPETSRIFAEIIFQHIDNRLESYIKEKLDNRVVFRRYVDDFMLFYNSPDDADACEHVLSRILSEFKLNLNSSKTESFPRPFVSAISAKRMQIRKLFAEVREHRASLDLGQEEDVGEHLKALSGLTDRIRERISEGGGEPNIYVPGAIDEYRRDLGFLRGSNFQDTGQARNPLSVLATKLFRCIFHLVATDPRVPVILKLPSLLASAKELARNFNENDRGFFDEGLAIEYDGLLEDVLNEFGDEGRIEPLTIMCVGRNHFWQHDQYKCRVRSMASYFVDCGTFDYWMYITLKYCSIRYNTTEYKELRRKLDQKAFDFALSRPVLDDAEAFLTAAALLNSSDTKNGKKMQLYKHLGVANYTAVNRTQLAAALNFVDWDAPNLLHLLRRRPLRPAYG